ncbi:NUDIX domain-containing protein [Bacillus gobiensis]|uniref:NUDIX hydrolase n=1 Tax=Bacillus gobiensis TaxID=1441095 RepID=UPI003D2148B1
MRDRGSAVLIENNQVALIKRKREDSTYYVFPGGGIENGETAEQAAVRETKEELGVTIIVIGLLAKVRFNGIQYFFLAEIIGGDFGTGQGKEFSNKKRGTYEPLWIDIHSLSSIDIRPREVSERIQSLFA